MTDDLFVDAYAVSTGLKQRIPRHWLDDPILGRDFRKTPSQRELDGELPPRPPGDAKGPEIAEFAEAAGIDLSGIKANADKLVAIEAAFGSGEEQTGVVAVDVEPVAADPLAPELVANTGEAAPLPAPVAPVISEGGEDDDSTNGPAGNASTESWLEYAKASPDWDDADADLGRDALREKYGTPRGDDDIDTTSTGDTESPDDTPATGNEEN